MKFTVKSIALSGVALAMFATVASAADIAAPAPTWTGFSLGIGGGGQFGFANTEAAGAGGFEVYDPNCNNSTCWIDGHYIFGNSGSANYGYAHSDISSGGAGYMSNFAGAALGGNVSSMISEIVNYYSDGEYGPNGSSDNDTGKAGFVGTLRAGFDYQIDQFVVGVDGAFNFGSTDIKNSASGVAGGYASLSGYGDSGYGGGDGVSQVTTDLNIGNSWSIGARAGFLASDHTLIFGSAGYIATQAELKARFRGSSDGYVGVNEDPSGYSAAGWDVSSKKSEWMNGYYLGAGIEQLVTDNISLKFEYRYANLGSIKTSKSDSNSVEDNSGGYANWDVGVAAKAEPVVHSINATINYRF